MVINLPVCKLLGISNLTGEAAVRAKDEWEKRFHVHDAYWIDVEAGQSAKNIAESLTRQFRERGVVTLSNETFVTAIFLDMTQMPDEKTLEEMIAVPGFVSSNFGCMMPLIFEFGSMGEIAFGDKPLFRKNAQQVIDINCRHPKTRKQLCLVAKSPLGSEENEHSWKAVMLFLDVLRRLSAPATAIPVAGAENPNDDIGFLRYGEYDQKSFSEIASQQAAISRALGTEGESELRVALSNARAELKQRLEEEFPLDATVQPIHPDMIVEGRVARWQAERHHNRKYDSARLATMAALDETGKQLERMIISRCLESVQDADLLLKEFAEKARLGIELEKDAEAMKAILMPSRQSYSAPVLPGMEYSESGPVKEIEDYLLACRNCAISRALAKFDSLLLNAYQNRTPGYYEERRFALTKEQNRINLLSRNLISKQSLISLIRNGGALPESCFNPIIGGGDQVRMAVCRNGEDDIALSAACSGTMTHEYYIDERYGGLKTLDSAPIKAVQLWLFNCDEPRLADLIPD